MFIREVLSKGELETIFIRGIRNLPSDGMTKPFGKQEFQEVRDALNGIKDVTELPEEERETSLDGLFRDEQ